MIFRFLTNLHLRFRKLFRASLKTLLLGLVLFSSYFAWSTHVRREHANAVIQLRNDGALVFDEFLEPIGPNIFWARSFCARKTAPMYYWQQAVHPRLVECPALFTPGWYQCTLQGHHIDRSQIELLPKLLHLEVVRIDDVDLAPEDIIILGDVSKLKFVTVIDYQLDRKAIPYFRNLAHVEAIDLHLPQFTEADLRELRILLPGCKLRTLP